MAVLMNKASSAPGALPSTMQAIAKSLLGILVLTLVLPAGQPFFTAEAAEFRIQPSIALSEEYDDNILLLPTDRQEEFVTRAIPGLGLHYRSKGWTWDVDYGFDYRHFERGTAQDDVANTLNLKSHSVLTDTNTVFFDMSDELGRASLDITRDFTQQSLVVNQAERNIFIANPYMIFKPASSNTLKLGYTYMNTYYSESAGLNRIDHITAAEDSVELASNLTFSTILTYTKDTNDRDSYEKYDIAAGPRYALGTDSQVFALFGKSWLRFSQVHNVSQLFWNAGITHKMSTVTVSLLTAVIFVEDPIVVLTREDMYTASVSYETVRTLITLTGGLRKYREIEIDRYLTKSTEGQLTVRYWLTPRSTATVGTSVTRLDHITLDTFTRITTSGLRYDYRLTPASTVKIEYEYLDSYSPVVEANNYRNNRAIVELKLVF